MDRLFFWSEHTAGAVHGTGIQRVVRNLARHLSAGGLDIVPVGWASAERRLRLLSRAEQASLLPRQTERLDPRAGDWLFVPEIPVGILADGLDPVRLGAAYGLRVAALIHDLIPVEHPDLYAPEIVAFYARYFAMFAEADLVVATTQHVATRLRAYLGPGRAPKIVVVPLSGEMSGVPRRSDAPGQTQKSGRLDLLTVSRFEPRKNLPRLLCAIATARAAGSDVRLTIVGRRGGYPAYEAEVDALLARMPWVREARDIDDDTLVRLYRNHGASIMPSWVEGFGLPILESLWLGTPCLCHSASAMAEVAPGGGALLLDMTDESAIAAVLLRLVREPDLLARLGAAAVGRCLRGWVDVARDVAAALDLALPESADQAARCFA